MQKKDVQRLKTTDVADKKMGLSSKDKCKIIPSEWFSHSLTTWKQSYKIDLVLINFKLIYGWSLQLIKLKALLWYTICFFEVRFLAALASWLCRLHRFWLFLANEFVYKFWAAIFFSGPRYVVISYCLLSDELKTNIQYVNWGNDLSNNLLFWTLNLLYRIDSLCNAKRTTYCVIRISARVDIYVK
jgi:hypothetical protein